MAFGDLDSVKTTAMQEWGTPNREASAYGKTEKLFTTEIISEDEVTWIPEWRRWNNLYRTIPELKGQIDRLALWIAGMGYDADENTIKTLNRIKGNGLDIFDSIMMNMIVQYLICGDGFAEILRDLAGRLINIKPLNPGEIRIVADKFGMIKKYEQISDVADDEGKIKILTTWQPKEIFHLSWNRVASEIHGIPTPEKLEQQIKKINIAKDITSVIHRRHAIPIKIWEVDEDDTGKVEVFKKKIDTTFRDVENIIVPMGSAKATVLQMQKGSIEEGISWIKNLNEDLTKGVGVPNSIQGSSLGSSEASEKIVYLGFQPAANWQRIFVEKQLKNQIGIEVKFKEPPSIDPSLLTDARKNTGDKVTANDPSKAQ